MPDYSLERVDFESGRGYVVVRNSDGQKLQWRTLPRSLGFESVNVVGEQFAGAALQDSSFAPGSRLQLVREPDNPYDANAIAVWNAARTLKVGYVPKTDARRLAKKIDAGQHYDVLSVWETVNDELDRTSLRILLMKPGVLVADWYGDTPPTDAA